MILFKKIIEKVAKISGIFPKNQSIRLSSAHVLDSSLLHHGIKMTALYSPFLV
jgi:hypothetical protein